MVAANPSLPRVVLPGSVASMATAVATVLAAIPVVVEASPVVSLTAPPPRVMAEEEKETETPASPGRGLHGSPSWSELKAPRENAAKTELERPAAVHITEVVDIPSDDEANDMVELPVSSQELTVVRSKAGPPVGCRRVT